MKSHLLFSDRSFDWSAATPWQTDALEFDLSLNTLYEAMAQNDPVIRDNARRVMLAGNKPDRSTVLYRQAILDDCLNQRAVIEELYAISIEALQKRFSNYLGTLGRYPHWVLNDAVATMERFGALLMRLRAAIDSHSDRFRSEGWQAFSTRVKQELTDAYFRDMAAHLRELKLNAGMLMSVQFSRLGVPTGFILHRYQTTHRSVWQRISEWFFPPLLASNTFAIHPRDEAGARALEQLRDDSIAFAAVTLAQSRDHIRAFFEEFRSELAFYLGCANLHLMLTAKGEPICYPTPHPPEDCALAFQNLYDVSLSLAIPQPVVGSTAYATRKRLILITGANQGGKSTFLRGLGLAQLMMQSGMFVGAKSFAASLCHGLYTHYKREESAALESGKFDEELARMSEIVDRLAPFSMVFFNESFAATNEREGSEIGLQILTGLMDRDIRVICVTHLYDLAHRLYLDDRKEGLFLRPERQSDGTRTFQLVEGEPLPTSFGIDLYRTIFHPPITPEKGQGSEDPIFADSKNAHHQTPLCEEYQEVVAGCQKFESEIATLSLTGDFSYPKLEKAEMELKWLNAWLKKIKSADSEKSATRDQADEALDQCDEHLSRYAQRVFEAHTSGT